MVEAEVFVGPYAVVVNVVDNANEATAGCTIVAVFVNTTGSVNDFAASILFDLDVSVSVCPDE